MVWKCSLCYGLVGCWYLEFLFGAMLGWLLVVMPLRLRRVCFGSLLFSVLVVWLCCGWGCLLCKGFVVVQGTWIWVALLCAAVICVLVFCAALVAMCFFSSVSSC